MKNYIYDMILLQLEQHKHEKIVFWGASNFLKNFTNNPDLKKYNILGIIDINKNLWNTYLNEYKIFSPDDLENLKPICIIDTVVNRYLNNYKIIKNTLFSKYKTEEIKLLPNVVHSYYDNQENNVSESKIGVNCEYVVSTEKEIEFFKNLGNEYKKYSEMTDGERLFLTSLIQRNKPKKILEVGVSKGGSSFLILNAMNTYEGAKLYSLDYNDENYRIKGKKTGFLIDDYPHLKHNWSLNTGGFALNFLDKISSSTEDDEKFDFCLLDTVHSLPGEVIDFLLVLPYLKKDCVLVLHDTNLHVSATSLAYRKGAIVNNILMSCIGGQKFLPYPKPYPYTYGRFNNIGAIKLNENAFSSLYEIFNLFTLPWNYKVKYEDLKAIMGFFDKHYPGFYSDYFKEAVLLQENYR